MRRHAKTAVVMGAGGFIGSHLVKRLKSEGYWVRGVDLKYPEYAESEADDFMVLDLRNESNVVTCMHLDESWGKGFDEVYQLAADMGGAGYIFTGEHDADVVHNSALINLHVAKTASKFKHKPRVFYSSSACTYPKHNQLDPENPLCTEESAYPADPDSEYGWEKLFSERLYKSFERNYGLEVRIARFHNIFGPEGSWDNGKEKAPAALCRKVAEVEVGGVIEVWGSGTQTRSFLYIDECLEAVRRLMKSDCSEVLNIGSEEMVSINELASMISTLARKPILINNVEGPEGVKGRNSDNTLIEEKLGWKPSTHLTEGLQKTYEWVEDQVKTKVAAL